MSQLKRLVTNRKAEFTDALRACRGEIWWSSPFWARTRMGLGVALLLSALVTLYVVLTQRMPGPDDFLVRDSYRSLAHMTDLQAVIFVGHVAHYGLLTVPLMYVFLAWFVVTRPYRRY